jgi:chemotaxis protein methyltransferase CheR
VLFSQKTKMSDQEFAKVSKVVYEHCGINLKADKQELVQSRLAKLIRKHKFETYTDYLDHVLSDQSGQHFTHFIDCLSTNLTSFFRERQHFDYLTATLIPSLLSKAPNPNAPRIRCWSAGCSSGEEPYTLAMVLSESIPAARRSNVKILASDISTRMVSAASDGYYPEQRLEGVAPAVCKKYFELHTEEKGRYWRAKNELRKMIIFKQINLMQQWPLSSGVDFIFCRNVMIYFDKPTQQKLVNRYYEVLAPGGMLFIGHSESLSGIKHPFDYVAPTIYLKK